MSSLTPGLGFLGILQYEREATWGTKPSITHRLPFYKASARPVIERIRPMLIDGTLAQYPTVLGPQACRLSLTIPVTYSKFPFFMDLMMGTATYAASGGATTGTNPYTHNWGVATPVTQGFKNLLNSISAEIVLGGIPSAEASLLTGLKLVSAKLRCNAGMSAADQIMQADLEFFGRRYQTGQGITAITKPLASTLDYVMFSHLDTFYDGSDSSTTSEQTVGFELSIDTMAAEDRVFMEGAGFVAEPQRKGKPKVSWSVTKEFQTRAALDAYIANTKGSCVANFNLSASAQFEILLAGAGIVPVLETPITGEGFIQQKITWEAEDAQSGGTSVTTMNAKFINANSTLTA